MQRSLRPSLLGLPLPIVLPPEIGRDVMSELARTHLHLGGRGVLLSAGAWAVE
ncbi:MAG TPA: hypothetical protein VNS22_14970 [Geminicoccus sp.]|uniref:hypothetical protein n=1 Tax=Geminicoccus sp. TaxID=2024832 RepID=UPI002BE1467F|nr:hypothetical protein [Geminicoccus sp.]HWL69671.1 hypothetical protein [Geminicoccus sp.]